MSTKTYSDSTIEQFINGRSRSITEKIRQILFIDTALKALLGLSLIFNIFLYLSSPGVLFLCSLLILALVWLAYFQMQTMKRLDKATDPGQNTRQSLSSLLTFLESRFDTAAFTMAATNPIFFISGILIYFYSVYGGIRRIDAVDLAVFSTLCAIGGLIGFLAAKGQVKYYKEHVRTCLSDLNENAIEAVASNIEAQRKQDRAIKMLLGLVLILGFVVLIAVLKAVIG